MPESPTLSPEGTADNSPRRKPWVREAHVKAPERGDRTVAGRKPVALSEGSTPFSGVPTAYAVGYSLPPPSEAKNSL